MDSSDSRSWYSTKHLTGKISGLSFWRRGHSYFERKDRGRRRHLVSISDSIRRWWSAVVSRGTDASFVVWRRRFSRPSELSIAAAAAAAGEVRTVSHSDRSISTHQRITPRRPTPPRSVSGSGLAKNRSRRTNRPGFKGAAGADTRNGCNGGIIAKWCVTLTMLTAVHNAIHCASLNGSRHSLLCNW